MPTAGIVIIGNEILSGKVADSNSPYFCRELRGLGVEVERIVTIPDVVDVIAAEVKTMRKAYDGMRTSSRKMFQDGGPLSWPMRFGNVLRPHNQSVSPVLRTILRAVDLGLRDNLWLDQQSLILAERLLFEESKRLGAERETQPANGSSLRNRLDRARLHMDERFSDPLRLQDLAGVAPDRGLRNAQSRISSTASTCTPLSWR